MATAKVEKNLNKEKPTYNAGDEVDIMIWQKTDLGFKVIIENQYAGLIYRDQIFKHVQTGDRMKAYIACVRPDGKIDLTLQPTGRQQTLDFSETLLNWLQQHDGYCELGDKSDAEEIKARFEVSKKVYKKAIGDLYRRRLIVMEGGGIRLVAQKD